MNKKEQKRVTNRVIKKLLKEETNADILDALSGLAAKDSATNQENFEAYDISLIIKEECSQEEVKLLRKCLISAIDQELNKKYSLLVTTRLVLALMELNVKIEKKKMRKRERACYRYVVNFNCPFGSEEEVLEVISDLANL